MPETTIQQLRQLRKKKKRPKARDLLLSWIMRKDGAHAPDIGKRLNRPHTTIHDWLRRGAYLGVAGRYDDQAGVPCWLSEEQPARLRGDLVAGPQACGMQAGSWTSKIVIMHVKDRFGVTYAPSSMQDILHKMDFSCRKPRPQHPKSPSEEEKEEFKKKLGSQQSST